MTSFTVPDLIGLAGVVQIVIGYFLLQSDKVTHDSLSYLFLNLSGASCILFSLFYDWNLPAVVIEVFWIAITLFGLWRHVIKKRRERVID